MNAIRPTQLDDAAAVAKCIDTIAKERRFIASVRGYSKEETRSYIEYLKQSDGVHLVVVVTNQIAGWCDIAPGIFDGLNHVGHLTMGLLNQHRGQGWGKKLLATALRAAFSKNIERIELYVFASNTQAIELYRHAGFQQEGIKRKARKLDQKYDDILVFGLLKEEWEKSMIANFAEYKTDWSFALKKA
jgi:RimJ/RimL family protein N-acetyltransferase